MYYIMFAILTAMLCFRYGQGTDYFGYFYLFEHNPETLNIIELLQNKEHTEVGWKFISALFKVLGLDYYVFVGVLGAVTMFFFNSFVQKFCPYKIMALLIAYPTLYLTYFSSGIRQGLVMSVFLGLLLDWYLKGKYVRFTIGALISAAFHSSGLVLLVLLLFGVRRFVQKNELGLIIVFAIAGILLAVFGFKITLFGRTFTNIGAGVSYIGFAERLLTFFLIKVCYDKYKKNITAEDEKLELLYYIYVLGTLGYCLTFSSPVIASRLFYMFKLIEIVLCTVMSYNSKKLFPEASWLFVYIVALSGVMLVKNIDNYISQGDYYDSVSVWNYPYHNVFTKQMSRSNYHFDLLDG